MIQFYGRIWMGLFFTYALGYSQIDANRLKFHGSASVEFGRLEEVWVNSSKQLDREMITRGSAWLWSDVELSESIDIHLGVGVMSFNVLDRDTDPAAQARRTAPGIAVASSRYTLGGRKNEKYPFRLELGIFTHKYNPHAKNLGEYMFRTMAMPIQIFTGGLDIIEMAHGYLTGAHVDGHLPGGFHWDAFYTLNMNSHPLKSHHFTLMADYNLMDILELGVGYQFQNLYYDHKDQLAPEVEDNMYYMASGPDGTEDFYYPWIKNRRYTINCPSIDTLECALYEPIVRDSVGNIVRDSSGNEIPTGLIGYDDPVSGDFVPTHTVTGFDYYTFRQQKAMARAALNFGQFLNDERVAPRDFSLYVEAILLGLDPVPVFAESWQERTPVMFGLTLPTFGVLDVLGIEFEYLSLKYNTSNEFILGSSAGDRLPMYKAIGPTENHTEDDWKFSLFARKTIVPGYQVFLQVARDHLRSMDLFSKYDYEETTQRGGGSLTNWGDFYWAFKLKYLF